MDTKKELLLKEMGIEHKKMKIAPPLVNADCFCCDKTCPACAALKVIAHYEPLIEKAREEGKKEAVNKINNLITSLSVGQDMADCAGNELEAGISEVRIPYLKYLALKQELEKGA